MLHDSEQYNKYRQYQGLPVDKYIVDSIGVGNQKTGHRSIVSKKDVNHLYPNRISGYQTPNEDQYFEYRANDARLNDEILKQNHAVQMKEKYIEDQTKLNDDALLFDSITTENTQNDKIDQETLNTKKIEQLELRDMIKTQHELLRAAQTNQRDYINRQRNVLDKNLNLSDDAPVRRPAKPDSDTKQQAQLHNDELSFDSMVTAGAELDSSDEQQTQLDGDALSFDSIPIVEERFDRNATQLDDDALSFDVADGKQAILDPFDDDLSDNKKKSNEKDFDALELSSNATQSLTDYGQGLSNLSDSFQSLLPNNWLNEKKNEDKSNNIDSNDDNHSSATIDEKIDRALASPEFNNVTNEQLLNQFIDDVKKYDSIGEDQLKKRAEMYDSALSKDDTFRQQVACAYVIRQNSDSPDKPLYPNDEKAIQDYFKKRSSGDVGDNGDADDLLKNVSKNLAKKKNEFNFDNPGLEDDMRTKLQELVERNNPTMQDEDDGFNDNPRAVQGRARRGRRFGRGRGVDLNAMNSPLSGGEVAYMDLDEEALESGVLASMRRQLLEESGVDSSQLQYKTKFMVW